MGVTKAIDMKFTNKFDVCRLQILLLDPNLIPQFVDVVIGDHLYELKFQVEENMNEDNLESMDMDDSSFSVADADLMGDKAPESQDKDLSKQAKLAR